MTNERAKEVARKLREGQPLTMRLLNEAADELERLRAALKPFAEVNGIDLDRVGQYLTPDDFKRAEEVLK